MELIIASNNKNKQEEILSILPHSVKLLTLKDIGFKGEIEETGTTLEENAKIKSSHIARLFGKPCLADDTGLEIASLAGRPGVYSARYAGLPPDPIKNMEKVLSELEGKDNREARFRTVLSYFDGSAYWEFEGEIRGQITGSPRGKQGFGYDPIFVPEGYEKTFAEMEARQKNALSHRSRALEKFQNFINEKSE